MRLKTVIYTIIKKSDIFFKNFYLKKSNVNLSK